jgi:pyruvate,orthophosphate dikinase
MRNLLGGKGCELAEMTNLGIPVPPGFTVTTQAWVHSQRAGGKWPDGLWDQILEHLGRLEEVADARFGDRDRPLLVSVRSGARVSMPGMMETILNLGLNDATVEGLAARSGNERFAWDCYRRFITMFSVVVLDIKREVFDALLDAMKTRLGAAADADVPASELRELVKAYQHEIATRTGAPFPQDVRDQLGRAIDAVFGSWFAKKATEYRRIHGIPEDWGTAVTVMTMVFGNLGDDSGTGVGFTRDPRTGEARFYAEFLPNAQGEGRRGRDPHPAPDRGSARADAEDLRRAPRHRHPARAALQGHGRTSSSLSRRGRSISSRRAAASGRPAPRCESRWISSGSTSSNQHTAILRVKPPEVNEAIRPVLRRSGEGGRHRRREASRAWACGRAGCRGGAASCSTRTGRSSGPRTASR